MIGLPPLGWFSGLGCRPKPSREASAKHGLASLFAESGAQRQKSYWSEALTTIAIAARKTTPAAPQRMAAFCRRRRVREAPLGPFGR